MAQTNYWLFKSEPSSFSLDDLKSRPGATEHWDGVRNFQARNFLRDEVKLGDLVLFYHSNIAEPAIVGIAEVVKAGYPDFTAFDPQSAHFDPRSSPEQPTWYMVDVRFLRELPRPVTLSELKGIPVLAGMALLNRSRLSIQPVRAEEWSEIMRLGGISPFEKGGLGGI
ncbi:MAG TPA: EVE domain-containing protein [Geobacter sp.]|nr:EVE domain-containing protein [Geobacter sp.]